MSWSALIGQQMAVRLLQGAVAAGKVAHAYLLAGPDGVGKRTLALELAKALNCLQPKPGGSACDTCSACSQLASQPPSHPDLILVEPDGRMIKTDQMREVQAVMYARPNVGRARVAIIDGADRMNPEAGNRVLKLLEEPPAYAVLVLLTQNLSGVLPTLVSRCQIVHCPPLSSEDVARALVTRHGLEPGSARLFASLSGGSIGRAVRLAADPAVLERRSGALDLLLSLPEADDCDLLAMSEGLEKQREHLDESLELLTAWLRDALLLTQGAPVGLIINGDRIDQVERLVNLYGGPTLLSMLEAVTHARSLVPRNVNVRLLLDVLLLQLKEGHWETT